MNGIEVLTGLVLSKNPEVSPVQVSLLGLSWDLGAHSHGVLIVGMSVSRCPSLSGEISTSL